MDLRDLACVVAVVDFGGFTAAADGLNLSQPALSKRIAALEAELGVALFHRVGRTVRLTAAGEAFVGPARQALHDVETARASVGAVVGLRGGHLDLGALPTLVVSHLAPWVGAFRREHPDVTVRIVSAESDAAVAALVHAARCDLALVDLAAVDPGLATEALFDQELLAVLPPGTDVPTRRGLRVDELAGRPVVVTPPGTSTRSLIDALFAEAGITPTIAVETGPRDALVPLVLAGAGLTFVSAPLADDAARRGAVVARLDPAPRRTIGLVARPGAQAPATQAFAALARRGPISTRPPGPR